MDEVNDVVNEIGRPWTRTRVEDRPILSDPDTSPRVLRVVHLEARGHAIAHVLIGIALATLVLPAFRAVIADAIEGLLPLIDERLLTASSMI